MTINELSVLTNSEIENHEHFSGRLTLPEGYTYYTLYPGGDKLWYALKAPNGTTLFAGMDFKPSPLYSAIDCVEAVLAGLSFLTLQDGATDREYFAKYTPEQLTFRDSTYCETLDCMISDFTQYQDERDPEYKADYEANYQYFISNYTQIIPA